MLGVFDRVRLKKLQMFLGPATEVIDLYRCPRAFGWVRRASKSHSILDLKGSEGDVVDYLKKNPIRVNCWKVVIGNWKTIRGMNTTTIINKNNVSGIESTINRTLNEKRDIVHWGLNVPHLKYWFGKITRLNTKEQKPIFTIWIIQTTPARHINKCRKRKNKINKTIRSKIDYDTSKQWNTLVIPFHHIHKNKNRECLTIVYYHMTYLLDTLYKNLMYRTKIKETPKNTGYPWVQDSIRMTRTRWKVHDVRNWTLKRWT